MNPEERDQGKCNKEYFIFEFFKLDYLYDIFSFQFDF